MQGLYEAYPERFLLSNAGKKKLVYPKIKKPTVAEFIYVLQDHRSLGAEETQASL